MSGLQKLLGSAFLAASLLLAIGNLGCSAHARVYDEYHGDWHTWGPDEDVYYRRYWTEHHESYRDYHKLNKDEQRDYWNWRHDQH